MPRLSSTIKIAMFKQFNKSKVGLPTVFVEAILLALFVSMAVPTSLPGETAVAKLPAAEIPAASGAVTTAAIVPTAQITQVLLAGKGGVPEDFSQPVSMLGLEEYAEFDLSDPVILDGYIYKFTGGGFQEAPGKLVCMDARTGKVKWKEKIGNGSMAFVDGCLLCLTYGGDLVLVERHPEGFKKLAEMKGVIARDLFQHKRAEKLNDPQADVQMQYAPCWAAPTVARGKVYLHYSDRLMCYDLMK